MRGYPAEGETCEVAGFGSVPPQVVQDLIESGDPFLKAIATKGKDVIGVAHLGRRPNAYQSTALDWLYPTCAVEGCPSRGSFLQTDHRIDWHKTHFTLYDLLDRLCPHHHRLKTTQGWALVAGKGKRAFVPPEDPRHPRHTGGPPEDLRSLRDAPGPTPEYYSRSRSTSAPQQFTDHAPPPWHSPRQRDSCAPGAGQTERESAPELPLFGTGP